MGDAQAPGGYFVGRPANYEEKPAAADDGQNPADTGNTPGGNHGQQQASPPDNQKKSGFFSNLFTCFSGSRAES